MRVAKEINASSVDNADVLDMDKTIDFDAVEEDKTFAAMGITKTIGTVRPFVCLCDSAPLTVS